MAIASFANALFSFGMLSSVLFTFKDYACDNDVLSLHCPPSTTLSIQWAQYGRLKPSSELCIIPHHDVTNESTNCLAPTSLQVVMKLCEQQQSCQVAASSQVFGLDPCPGTSKYLEVAFKCRPDNIRVETVCENSVLDLQCPDSLRLAIHSAVFGRTRDSLVPQSVFSSSPPPPQCVINHTSYDTECQSPCAVRRVLEQCHAKRQCLLLATEEVFGQACRPGTAKYLSVVYTCVPAKVLRAIDKSELKVLLRLLQCPEDVALPVHPVDEGTSPAVTASRLRPLWHANGSMAARPAGGSDFIQEDGVPHYVLQPYSDRTSNGFINDWVETWVFLRTNSEKCALYFTISFLLGVVVLLLCVVCRLSRRRDKLYDHRPAVRSMRGVWTTPEGLGLLRESPTMGIDSPPSPLYGFDRVGDETVSRQSTLSRPSPYQQYTATTMRSSASHPYSVVPAATPTQPPSYSRSQGQGQSQPSTPYGVGGARPVALHHDSYDDGDFVTLPVQQPHHHYQQQQLQQQQQQPLLQQQRPISWATVGNGRTAPRQYYDNVYRR